MIFEGFYQFGFKERVEEFCLFINILQILKNKVLREDLIFSNLMKLLIDLREKFKFIF